MTPYSDRALFPLTALIRTHDVPCLTTPAHVVRQLEPVTVAATVTLAPVRMTIRTRALVEGVARRLTWHKVVFAVVAPRTSPGIDTELTTKQNRAAMTAAAMRVVREARAA